jgi:CDP-glucose 4,6-dehydratase
MSDGFWRGRRVFVTGCAGLLGSWMTERLLDEGAEVVGLVRDRVPESRFFRDGLDRRITIVTGSVEDLALLGRTLDEHDVEAVFHLAAQAIVGIGGRNPVATFETNVRGTWNLLESVRTRPHVKRVVIASSDKAYGDHEDLPYTERTPLEGRHPYDVSKSCADLIAQAYHHSFGVPVAITRCGNLFGGGDLNWNRIVPGTIRSALHDRRPVIRSDGTSLRDYVYVRDAVDGYLLLAQALDDDDIPGQAFNLGPASPFTVLEITRRILTVMGRTDLEPDVRNEASGEIPKQHLDSTRARERLGWAPRVDMDTALAQTIDWYRNAPELTSGAG